MQDGAVMFFPFLRVNHPRRREYACLIMPNVCLDGWDTIRLNASKYINDSWFWFGRKYSLGVFNAELAE